MNRFARGNVRSAWLVAAALYVVARASSVSAQRTTSLDPLVSIEPAVTYIQSGDLCTLSVVVGGADSLSCMGVVVAFDTAFGACLGAIEGSSFDEAGYLTFFYWEMPAVDTVSAVDCLLGYRTYFLAPGELVKFVFKGKSPGSCPVSIASARLFDINRIELAPAVGSESTIVVESATGEDAVPQTTAALWNYPNPFNPTTVLVLSAPGTWAQSKVDLSVYSASGRKIRGIYSGWLAGERVAFCWDGKDDRGGAVAAGFYMAVARVGDTTLRRKLILMR